MTTKKTLLLATLASVLVVVFAGTEVSSVFAVKIRDCNVNDDAKGKDATSSSEIWISIDVGYIHEFTSSNDCTKRQHMMYLRILIL